MGNFHGTARDSVYLTVGALIPIVLRAIQKWLCKCIINKCCEKCCDTSLDDIQTKALMGPGDTELTIGNILENKPSWDVAKYEAKSKLFQWYSNLYDTIIILALDATSIVLVCIICILGFIR